MISKPPGGWDRNDRTVEAARQFGNAASKALSASASGVARARAIYRAAICALMAVMLGWAGLSAGLIGGNRPTMVGAGCGSLLLAWVAMRELRTAFGSARSVRLESTGTASTGYPNTGRMALDAGSIAPVDGSAIYYDRKKLCIGAAARWAVCMLLAWVITLDTHRTPVITCLVLAGMGFGLWRVATFLIRAIDKDSTAIAWDGKQICVRTLISSRRVPWQSVESVDATRRVLRLLGFITVWRSDCRYLLFRLRQDGSSHKMKVPASALTIRPGEAEALMRKVVRRHAQRAVNTAAVGRQSDFCAKTIWAQPDPGARETGADMVPEAAEWTRAARAYDRTALAPATFGRKATS